MPRVGELDCFGRLDPFSVDVLNLQSGRYLLRSNHVAPICLGFGDEKNLGDICNIHMGPKICDCSVRNQPGAVLLGPAFRLSYPCSRRICSVHNALVNRHGTRQPICTATFAYFHEFVGAYANLVEAAYHDEPCLDEAIWMKKWTLSKQAEIVRQQQLRLPDFSRVKAFVKFEGGHRIPKKARLIQGYADLRAQAYLGPRVCALQKACSKMFPAVVNHGIRVVICSGFTVEEVGAWMEHVLNRFGDGVRFYERDGANWDSTMNAQLLECKLAMVQSFTKDEDLCTALRLGVDVKGKAAIRGGGSLSYTLNSTTKSGHNDTTIGNGLINAYISYSACRSLGLSAEIIVAGDDCLMGISGDFDEKALATEEARFGIVPEYAKIRHYACVSFVSGLWYPGKHGLFFGPRVGRLLARLNWTTKAVASNKRRIWQRSVAAGLQSAVDIPVLRALIANMVSPGPLMEVGHKAYKFSHAVEVDEASILLFVAQRYGISPADIFELECFIKTCGSDCQILKHPVADRIMEWDFADPAQRPINF